MIELNYFNIMPIFFIEVIIIMFFEAFIYVYVINAATLSITTSILEKVTSNTPISILFHDISHANKLSNSKTNETNYISKNNTYGFVVLGCVIFITIILFLIYIYIVVYRFKKHIEWFNVSIIVIIITIFIIIIETIYMFVFDKIRIRNEAKSFLLIQNVINNYAKSQNPQPS
jgi:hypothetical protein